MLAADLLGVEADQLEKAAVSKTMAVRAKETGAWKRQDRAIKLPYEGRKCRKNDVAVGGGEGKTRQAQGVWYDLFSESREKGDTE